MLELIKQARLSLPGMKRLFEILSEPVEPRAREELIPGTDSVVFKDVCFSYDGEHKILDNISFSLEKGKSIALVGPSGGGKSTVLKLLCGFYFADSGSISVFGSSLNEDSIGSLRQKIALVSQDSYLFPGTVAENIACGAGDVPMERIIEAAKAANAHNFIVELKDGYDTRIGQEGSLLSGGQKQRISIARAVLKNTEILLLDEPTSALDAESEAAVQEALANFMKNRTSLVVAHRLSTIKNAHEVLVLDGGRIVERGTHEELIGSNTLYRKLYLKQLASQDDKDEGGEAYA
jgi:subfamily B ATP-binding cassette protein MsbA/ATP-binding cassette subfamily B protein AbcA/BmrA